MNNLVRLLIERRSKERSWWSSTKVRIIVFFSIALISGCGRAPVCDGRKAEELMAETIYSMTKWQFWDGVGDSTETMNDVPESPQNTEWSKIKEQVTDLYFPHVAMRLDARWLKNRIPEGVDERFKILNVSTYLMLDNWAALRKAVRIRMTDHEHVPDQVKDQVLYKNVCRANVWIEPVGLPEQAETSVRVTYSVNPPPRSTRTHAAGPFYVAVAFLSASESPLKVELTNQDKIMLMAMGVRRRPCREHSINGDDVMRGVSVSPFFAADDLIPSCSDTKLELDIVQQSAKTILTRRALRAFRQYYEKTAKPSNKPYFHPGD